MPISSHRSNDNHLAYALVPQKIKLAINANDSHMELYKLMSSIYLYYLTSTNGVS